MSKKFSIIKGIDLDKLDNLIDKYICETGEMNPYLFMCAETIDAISETYCSALCPEIAFNSKKSNGFVGLYEGNKIFIDNTLPVGTVEIR